MGLIVAEYMCSEHGRFEETIERPAPDDHPCPECGANSPWTISAPRVKVQYGSVTTGKADEAFPGALDTRALADGMPLSEWKAERAKQRRDERWKRNREAVS